MGEGHGGVVTSEARTSANTAGPRVGGGTAHAAHQELSRLEAGARHRASGIQGGDRVTGVATGGLLCPESVGHRRAELLGTAITSGRSRCTGVAVSQRDGRRWGEGGRNPFPCASASWISDTGKWEEGHRGRHTSLLLIGWAGERAGLWGQAACFLGPRWVVGKPLRRWGSDGPGGAAPALEPGSMSIC